MSGAGLDTLAGQLARVDAQGGAGIRPIVLGILNVTPDSFSDGGEHASAISAIAFGRRLMSDGADIVDVGGESTRPGAVRLDVDEEQRRVLPVVRELVARGIPVSIDTMNASTASHAIDLGAVIVNDVTAGSGDPRMPALVAEAPVMFVAMHSRGPSATMQSRAHYDDTVSDVRRELGVRVDALVSAGVDRQRIIIDPGLGFAKHASDNWRLLAALRQFADSGPVLVGASRKGFLGELLPAGASAHERDPATAVISALAADAGVWGVRVHNVVATVSALAVWQNMNPTALRE